MNWNESVYLIKEIEQLIAAQTTAISSSLGAGNAIYFSDETIPTTANNGDILFIIKEENSSSPVTEENNQSTDDQDDGDQSQILFGPGGEEYPSEGE